MNKIQIWTHSILGDKKEASIMYQTTNLNGHLQT